MAAAEQSVPDSKGATRASSRARVVVVDHDPDLRRLVAQVLREEGYAAAEPSDPDHPYGYILEVHPDLLILDFVYRHEDAALGTLTQLTQDPRTASIPVLAYSTTPTQLQVALEQQGKQALYTLAKPFDLDDLLGTIDSILRTHPPDLAPPAS